MPPNYARQNIDIRTLEQRIVDLTGDYALADWGVHNAIRNGGNQPGQWRTLTISEWVYVFNTRPTTSTIRYAKAVVNNIKGVILLPDDWNTSYHTLNFPNDGSRPCTSNVISAADWANKLEANGAIFLPAAGNRTNDHYASGVNRWGSYWAATQPNAYNGHAIDFKDDELRPQTSYGRHAGYSVRLVKDVD